MVLPEPGGTGAGLFAPSGQPATIPLVRVRSDTIAIDAYVREAYRTHQRELFGFLMRVTRDAGSAEDMAQETFLRLYRELRSGAAPPDNVRAWLYRVAGNLAMSRLRHLSVARRWLDRSSREEETFEAPERTAIRLERHERLETALGGLSRDQRVGLLMAAQGFSGHEVAEALGRTDVSTRTMLCRARLRLRSQLEGDEAT